MENLDDLLTGRDRPDDVLAEGLVLDLRDKILRDLKMNVGLEQRHAHLAHRVADVRLGERTVAAQVLENILKLVAELGKHGTAKLAAIGDRASKADQTFNHGLTQIYAD